jgi:hypothetical protein
VGGGWGWNEYKPESVVRNVLVICEIDLCYENSHL